MTADSLCVEYAEESDLLHSEILKDEAMARLIELGKVQI